MSQMEDPKADDRLNEDQRFRSSDSSSIDPMHAVMRCIAQGGGSPMNESSILQTFRAADSSRTFEGTDLNVCLVRAKDAGYLDLVPEIGWRLTEDGRSELGPILEMDLRYV